MRAQARIVFMVSNQFKKGKWFLLNNFDFKVSLGIYVASIRTQVLITLSVNRFKKNFYNQKKKYMFLKSQGDPEL